MKQHSKSRNNISIKEFIKLKDDGKHYSANKYFSYHDIFLGIITGGRGIGKTTTFLKKGLINTDNDEEFIYIRRYKPEIKNFISKNSLEPLIDGIIYKGDGTGGYIGYFDDKKIGYFIALSTARSYKSTDFSKVSLIIFDEGIVRQTSSYRYLNDEVIEFLEFISTVIRTRTNVKVVILGNNEDLFSPYHVYFNVPTFENFYIDREHKLYCENAKNSPLLLEDEKKTGLFSLIKDTGYGSYHYDNKLITSNICSIKKNKPNNASLMFRLIANGYTINIYIYADKNAETRLWCERKEKTIYDNYTYRIFENGQYNKFDIALFKTKVQKWLSKFFYYDRCDFNDEKCNSILMWIMDNTNG